MTDDELLVRDVWKRFPRRVVVGERLVRSVGARGWERPRFARFRRFFERCGVPDPWDPGAGEFSTSLGEVGVAQRKVVAPHAAPPPASGAPQVPSLPNVPRAPAAPPPDAPHADSKPAPRIGEQRRDDTAELKRKLAESEKKRANPTHANTFKVNQPVAKLPMRPELSGEAVAAIPKRTRPGPSALVRPGPARPGAAASTRPFRLPVEPARPSLPDGPEELPEVPLPRPAAFAVDFGMGGGWDDDVPKGAPVREPERPVSRAVDAPPAPERPATRVEQRPSPAVPAAPRTAPPSASAAPPRPPVAPPTSPPPATAPAARPVAVTPPSASTPPSHAATPPRPPASSRPEPARAAPAANPPRPASSPPASAPSTPPARALPPAAPKPPLPKPGAPPPRGGGGLDDLFGLGGGGDNTRFRMPKREEAEASRPRRPMVTPEAELGKAGIDRRPPPPKPPSVRPSGSEGGGGFDPEGDGGD